MDDKDLLPNEVVWNMLAALGILSAVIVTAFLLSLIFPSIVAEVFFALGILYCGVAIACIIYILYFILKELRKNIL